MNRALAVTSSLAAGAFCLALAAGGGCGSNNPTAPSGTGGVTVLGAGGMGATGGAGAADCPAIENIGDTITQEQASGAAPTPMGGTVVDGTYVLTRSEAYPPVSANPPGHSKETLRIAGTVLDLAVSSDDFPTGYTARATFGASGTEFSVVFLCGPGAGQSFMMGYTATATELILISDPGSVETFTKR
jgi:hypothetical protein